MAPIHHTDQELLQILIESAIKNNTNITLHDMPHLLKVARTIEESTCNKYQHVFDSEILSAKV